MRIGHGIQLLLKNIGRTQTDSSKLPHQDPSYVHLLPACLVSKGSMVRNNVSISSLTVNAGMGVLWSEFVRELRWHWENLVIIPRTSLPRIQYNSCLIYQKLQMVRFPPQNCLLFQFLSCTQLCSLIIASNENTKYET